MYQSLPCLQTKNARDTYLLVVVALNKMFEKSFAEMTRLYYPPLKLELMSTLAERVPTIDLANDDYVTQVAKVREAATDLGFFQVLNHEVFVKVGVVVKM